MQTCYIYIYVYIISCDWAVNTAAFRLSSNQRRNSVNNKDIKSRSECCCRNTSFQSCWTLTVSLIEICGFVLHLRTFPAVKMEVQPNLRGWSVIRVFLFMSACLSGSDKLTNQLEASVWRIIPLFSIKIAGLQILPFHFAACLLPSTFHNSSVTPAIFHMPPSNNTAPLPPAFEGVNQTGELNAYLMSQRQLESGD